MNEIGINNPEKRFEKHLQVDKNYRIIFSGNFGIGKTFFLNKYFDNHSDRYNKFIVSPVNYVVSTNEDIFELIKADIIEELFLKGKIQLKSLPKDNTMQNLSSFAEHNQLFLLKFLLKTISKLNPSSTVPNSVLEPIEEIYKNYKNHLQKQKKEELTRSEELEEYWNSFENKIGSIYEHNYITKLINGFLSEIKEPGNKKNILIIDDLDRIDPEHIFRILNVLSAHNNKIDSVNKFNFDHVILVCDLVNIKNIFFHRYGPKVDFNGYIDKFFSTDYFYYSNEEAIVTYIENVFPKSDSGANHLLLLLLRHLNYLGLLNLRQLFKHRHFIEINNFKLTEQRALNDKSHILDHPKFIANWNLFVDSDDLHILQIIKLLSIVYGDINIFYSNILKLKNINETIDYADCQNLISYLALQSHISTTRGDSLYFSVYKQEQHFITALNHPIKNFLKRNFRIRFLWDSSNKYDATISYFNNASAIDNNPIGTSDGKTGIEIEVNLIFNALIEIIHACHKNGYLEKAEIKFNPTEQ